MIGPLILVVGELISFSCETAGAIMREKKPDKRDPGSFSLSFPRELTDAAGDMAAQVGAGDAAGEVRSDGIWRGVGRALDCARKDSYRA